MSFTRMLSAALVIGFLLAVSPLPSAAQDKDANVPQTVLTEMEQAFRPTRQAKSRQEYIDLQAKQMGKVIEFGQGTEALYPKAPNLHEIQRRMLVAADFVVRYKPSADAKARRQAIAKRILASNAPPETKVTPDYFVTVEKVAPAGGEVAKDAEKQIRAFLKPYAKTDAIAVALVRASQLAQKAELKDLETEYLDTMEKKYSDDPQINTYLRRMGRHPMFFADLTLVDGAKLSLPGDRLGKVVVIDFWATWCGPCITYLPHIKKVYREYKDKGVEFVGISLDKAGQKQHLIDFVKKNDMPWSHAYSGKYWDDPTAVQYGVRGIPAIWVIGKDGGIFSDNARADLEGTLDKALAEKPKATK
ncbi:MAG: TlpA family protein disulfide reductase [Phycisphaerae bacterium]|nr:TlpA family protein disulfide reductase [Phycisphaerae bacterium]